MTLYRLKMALKMSLFLLNIDYVNYDIKTEQSKFIS